MNGKDKKRDFANEGFKVLADHPKLKAIASDLRGDKRAAEARKKLETLKARLDAPPLDLRGKYQRLPKVKPRGGSS